MAYDSRTDTALHILNVARHIEEIEKNIDSRKRAHDESKLQEPEKSMYDEFTPKLRGLTYGSDEYKECLKQMGPALQHHYEVNGHHPEHFKMWRCPLCESVFKEEDTQIDFEPETRLCPNCCAHGAIFEAALEPTSGIYGMSLLDLIEMLADWKAATARHSNGSIEQSMEVNRKRFGMSDQLYEIFINTIRELGW